VLIGSMGVAEGKLRVVPRLMHEVEVELAQRAAGGDRAGQRAFVVRLLPQVRRTASFLGRDRATSEDLAQSALVVLLKASGTYRGDSSLEFWAAQITSRVAFRELKKRRRRQDLDAFAELPPSPFAGVEESAERRETAAALRGVLGKLSDDERAAVILKYVEGFSLDEIAATRDEPVNTVRTRLLRAKKKLKGLICRQRGLAEWSLGGSR